MSICLFSSLSDVKRLFFNAGGQQHINGGEIGDKYISTYGCPVKKGRSGYLLQSNDDDVPNHVGGQKWGDLSGLD